MAYPARDVVRRYATGDPPLARAQLMAAIVRPLDDATRLLRDETGCAGDPIPESVVAALKEKFTLGLESSDELAEEEDIVAQVLYHW